jgi:hypothetical protein
MALKQPAWVKEAKAPVKEQITIVAASPLRTGKAQLHGPIGKTGNAPDEMEEQGMTMEPIPMRGETRYTGEGQDGELDPNKVAGDVHEGEIVIDAATAENIPEDIMQALVEKFQSGEATSEDTNALRQALGIPEQEGYSLGSWAKKVAKAAGGMFGASTAEAAGGMFGASTAEAAGTAANKKSASDVYQNPVTQAIRSIPETTPETTPRVARTVTTDPLYESITPLHRMARTITTESPKATITAIPSLSDISKKSPVQPASLSQGIVNRNLARLDQIAAGNSQADQNITDSSMRRYDTQAATSLAAGDQQIAALGNDVPDIVKQSLMAQNRSGVRSQGSDLLGTLAINAEQNAQNSANQAAGLGLTSDQQQFNQAATLRTEALNNAKTLMEAGIGQNLQGIVDSFGKAGITINPESLTTTAARQNFSDGMDLITKGIASGFSDDQIIASLTQNGIDPAIFGTSSTGGSGVQGIIQSNRTASNSIDSMINSINSSTTLNADEKAKAIAYFKYIETNPEDTGLEVVSDGKGGYVVRAKAGSSTAQTFSGDINGADAQAVLTEGSSNPYYSSVISQKADNLISSGNSAGIIALANSTNASDKDVYAKITGSAKSWVPMTAAKADGKGATFTNPPQSGTVINYGGKSMLVIGSNTESMYTVDLSDGSIHQYYANTNNSTSETPVDEETKKTVIDRLVSASGGVSKWPAKIWDWIT